jgi:hypothetical protein
LPSLTREAHQKELERIRKQKELDELEQIALRDKESTDIIDISSGDEVCAARAAASPPRSAASALGPLVCTVASDRRVVNLEPELVGILKSHQVRRFLLH